MIFTISSIPGCELPRYDLELPDKLIHFIIYAPLGVLALRAFCGNKATTKLFFRSLLFTSLFAVVDEAHQAFIPGRHVEVIDLTANLLGLLMGHLAYLLIRIKQV